MLQDKIFELSQRIRTQKENISTEEATKHSFVLPFLNALGYDVFNPQVIVPEFTADIGTKKGEKVDYAILKDNKPLVLIEVKNHTEKLDNHSNQLIRYFNVVADCKFAILTNGIEYRFFSDLDKSNIMDEVPFMILNLESMKQRDYKELEKFTKEQLDIEQITKFASNAKNYKQIQEIFKQQLENPDDDFVKFFATRITNKRMTESIVQEFRNHIKKALSEIVNDLASDKILAVKNSLAKDEQTQQETEATNNEKEETQDNNLIVTTEEELQGFYIVKSFFADNKETMDRISYRDTIQYFGIMIDNKTYKWFVRLWFNGTQKYITIPTTNKDKRINIDSVSDIYSYKDEIIEAFRYKNNKTWC